MTFNFSSPFAQYIQEAFGSGFPHPVLGVLSAHFHPHSAKPQVPARQREPLAELHLCVADEADAGALSGFNSETSTQKLSKAGLDTAELPHGSKHAALPYLATDGSFKHWQSTSTNCFRPPVFPLYLGKEWAALPAQICEHMNGE